MKRAKRFKIYTAILLLIMPVFLSGCWDSIELNKLSILAGIGWDIEPDTGVTTMTYQSIVPSQVKNPSGSDGGVGQKGGGPMKNIQIDHTTGSSPYDALNRYTQHGTRTPFYQHVQVLVFGKYGAKLGIYPFLDTVVRTPVSRPNMLMVVSEQSASDILSVQDGMESIQAIGMAEEIKLSASFSKYPAVTFLEFANRLLSKTTAPIAPMIGIIEDTGPDGKKQKKIHITGTAVFKGDKMIGALNERESSGLLWATNKIQKGYVIIPEASLQIIKANSKIIPELNDGKIKITIKIHEESNLIEYNGHQDMSPGFLKQLEKAQDQEIESQVMAAVQKSYFLNADVFGFGDEVHRKYKKEWQIMKMQWDDIYPDIEVSVIVDTHLNQIGDIRQFKIKE